MLQGMSDCLNFRLLSLMTLLLIQLLTLDTIAMTTKLAHSKYMNLNPSQSDIGPISTPPSEIPRSAQAINRPNNILRSTF